MSAVIRWFSRYYFSLFVVSVAIGLAGCEGSSDSHIWDGFDFGNNNPDLYMAMGDSITSGYGLESVADAYPSQLSGLLNKRVINLGVQGSQSSYGASYASSALNAYKPGYLLILYGVNDLILNHSVDSVLANLRAMISTAKSNQTIPVVATLTPVFEWYTVIEGPIALLNAGIRLICAEEDVHVADVERAFNWNSYYMNTDGLHPNKDGQALIASTFYDVLK